MNTIKTTSASNKILNKFAVYGRSLVINHAAPAAIQQDEEALQYVWREIICSQNHWNIDFVCTPKGNVYRLNPCYLHHYFDNGRISLEDFKKEMLVGYFQEISALPEIGKQIKCMINLYGVYPA